MNYNSVDEILSAGISNMEVIRNNTKQDDGTDTVSSVSWFTFNNAVISNIYVNGNSWFGFGSTSEHLKVNRRDGALWSLYREEGTLYNYYKFLKIRWSGYSSYNQTSSSYALEYDVILWDTGDISLHMISIPTSSSNGTYSLVASSTYSYTVSTLKPDVTFIKTDTGFTVNNEIINLTLPYEKRYLIRSNSTYYTIENNTLKNLGITSVSSTDFLNYGVEEILDISLLLNLSAPEVLYWTNNENGAINNLIVHTNPPFPQMAYYEPQNIAAGSTIKTIDADCSEDTLFAITFDEGITWKYYNPTTSNWINANSNSEGMNLSILNSITSTQWQEATTSSKYQIRCAFFSKESYNNALAVKYE